MNDNLRGPSLDSMMGEAVCFSLKFVLNVQFFNRCEKIRTVLKVTIPILTTQLHNFV